MSGQQIKHTFHDDIQFVSDIRYLVINSMGEIQDLCGCHQSLLLSQSVQSPQRVFNVLPPHKLLQEFFCAKIRVQSRDSRQLHTRSTLFHLLRRNCEDVQNFYHNFHNYIGHRVGRRHFCIGFKPLEEVLDALEQIGKGFFACADILGGLTKIAVEYTSTTGSRRILTKKRIPIPAEITFAGGNICENIQAGMRRPIETYQSNPLSQSHRECVEDVDSRSEPP